MKNKLSIFVAMGLLSISLANAQNQWLTQNSGTSAFLTSVYFVSADTGYVCSQAGAVLKTTNGGLNWNNIGTGPGNSLCFLNSQKGFGVLDDKIFYTQNGGTNWSPNYSNPDLLSFQSLYFPDNKHGYAIALTQMMDNMLVKTSNYGLSWDTIYKYSDNLALFVSVFFKDSLNGFIGADNGKILKTTNGGTIWSILPVDLVNKPSFSYIYFPTPDTGFAATDIHGVYRTIDGGNTWNHLSSSFPPALYSVWFTDANHGFVGGGDGLTSMTLYKTNNGGNTWTQSASGVQALNAMYFVDSMPGYAVGTNGTILKYTHSTGINDNVFSETNLNLYPNPATDKLTIETPQKAAIEILNLQGQLVKSFPNEGRETPVDVSELTGGVYILKLTTEEGSVVRKFVKE
jgi:photosystem II stability/assembly factor-like uncharacterized protein